MSYTNVVGNAYLTIYGVDVAYGSMIGNLDCQWNRPNLSLSYVAFNHNTETEFFSTSTSTATIERISIENNSYGDIYCDNTSLVTDISMNSCFLSTIVVANGGSHQHLTNCTGVSLTGCDHINVISDGSSLVDASITAETGVVLVSANENVKIMRTDGTIETMRTYINNVYDEDINVSWTPPANFASNDLTTEFGVNPACVSPIIKVHVCFAGASKTFSGTSIFTALDAATNPLFGTNEPQYFQLMDTTEGILTDFQISSIKIRAIYLSGILEHNIDTGDILAGVYKHQFGATTRWYFKLDTPILASFYGQNLASLVINVAGFFSV
jgi:hypothetical protein